MSEDTVLRGHEVFAHLNVDEISRLSTFSSTEEFCDRDIIFECNQAASHIYLLMEGLVYLQLPADPAEFNLTVLRVEKGELFGISPLLNSARYTLTAQCFKDTKVLSIEAESFRELLRVNCPAGMHVMNRVAHIYFTRYIELIKRLQNVMGQITLTTG